MKSSGPVYDHRSLLAFVHIEKAAGTTLVDLFRNNFHLRFFEVRPLLAKSDNVFTADDLRIALCVNPFTRVLSGHAVKPFSDLQLHYPNLQYITLLRDPVRRYISNYQYWVERLGRGLTIEDYFGIENARNFQTRKIAGGEDVELAKQILAERFLLVGTVERFDEFIVMLRRFSPIEFRPGYQTSNQARDKRMSMGLFERYADRIAEQNALDIELYRFACEEVIPAMRAKYGGTLTPDVDEYQSTGRQDMPSRLNRYLYYLYKKVYCIPVTGYLRKREGLPAAGSYGLQKRPLPGMEQAGDNS